MRIMVCGAGSVGRSIVSYLAKGNNDIVVIDNDQQRLDDLSKEWDIQPILGSPSHPDVLEKAGIKKVDIVIAATNNDEVNMITCQMAHSLFNVPKKIARLDSEIFSNPLWSHLYNDDNIPIDKIINPSLEIAQAIFSILKIPGTSEVVPFADTKLHLLAFRCTSRSPLVKTSISHIERLMPDIGFSIASIVRQSKNFIPSGDDIIEIGDEIYMLLPTEKLEEAVQDLGISQAANEKVIIFGGNSIARYLARYIELDDSFLSCKIIEEDYHKASKLAKELDDTVVIKGDMMSDTILNESGIEKADVTIALTLKDKENILSSLIAKKRGVHSTLSLVNSRSYSNLVDNIGSNILIDRSSVTISPILQDLRRPRIINAHSLGRGFGEIWEIRVHSEDLIVNSKISELKLPKDCNICAICRDDKVIFPNKNEKFKTDDLIIMFTKTEAIKKVETIFS